MEDEIIKHSETIRKEIKNKKHSILEKIKEIAIEIFIIIFSVTISIWFHNWSEHKHQQKEVKEFLTDLKTDLNIDIQNMEDAKKSLNNGLNSIGVLVKDSSAISKTFKRVSLDFINRETHQGDYESFKSSGKIGYIENNKIKRMMITYYEEEMPPTYNIEKMFNQKIIELYELPESNKDLFEKKLYICKQSAIGLIRNYDDNIQTAKDIINSIAEEYN